MNSRNRNPRDQLRANVAIIVGGASGYFGTTLLVWFVCERLIRPDMNAEAGQDLYGPMACYPFVLLGILAPIGCLLGSILGFRLAIRNLRHRANRDSEA